VNGAVFTLEELQGYVGYDKSGKRIPCLIQPVFFYESDKDGDAGYTQCKGVMLVNEDGLLLDLIWNLRAIEMAGQEIVGNVILLTPEEWNACN
jgi:hypothetical protein